MHLTFPERLFLFLLAHYIFSLLFLVTHLFSHNNDLKYSQVQ